MCGEKFLDMVLYLHPLGSPPRVRGKVEDPYDQSRKIGITPACAGKSSHLAIHDAAVGDHPRVCGEKLLAQFLIHISGGSPPRVRGKVTHEVIRDIDSGITPVCAGKS